MKFRTTHLSYLSSLFLGLLCCISGFSQITIVSDGTWKGVGNSALSGGTAWLFQGYNDAAWPLVEAPNAGNTIPVVGGSQSFWVLPYSDTAKMRKTFIVPVGDSYNGTITINADNEFTLYFNGASQGFFNNWMAGPYTFNITPALQGCVQNVIAVDAVNWSGPYGCSLSSTINVVNPLNTPVATAATGVTCNSFTANWDSVATADAYLLDVSTDPLFGSFYSVYQDFNVGAVTSFNLTGLPGPGPYYYRVRCQRTNALGTLQSCYSNNNVITVNLVVQPPPNAGNDVYICPGSSTSLNATGAGTVSWSPTTGLSPTNILTPTVNPLVTTTYTLTITNGACSSTDSVTVFIANLPPLVLSNDTTICPGNSVDLTVAGGDYFVWSPYPGIVDSSLTTQTVSPLVNTTYTVTSYTVGSNIITNGDFSVGNTGFSSSYTYAFPNTLEGQYFVGTNPQAWNGGLSPCGDHTTGAGNMIMVNGSAIANSSVWCQTVPVSPNTDYLFSAWITPAYSVNLPSLQFSINGVPLGSPFSPTGPNCTWEEFFATWNSGVSTTANICIVNQNTNTAGNDFAIDDISFSPVCTQVGTVDVTIGTLPVPVVNNTGPYCTGDTIQLNSPSGFPTDDWTGPSGYIQNDTQNPTINAATLVMAGDYTVTVTDPSGCSATGITTVVINGGIVANANNTGPYCAGDVIDLTSAAVGGTNYDWVGPASYVQNSLQNPNIPSSTTIMSGIYTVTVTNANGCSGTATTNVLVNALPVSIANSNTPVCEGVSFTVTGGGAVNYDWTGPNGFAAANTTSATVVNSTLIDAGIYTVTGTDANGCSSTATVTVIVYPSPTAAFTADVTTGCAPLCVNFTDNSNVAGSTITGWSWNIESQTSSSTTNTSYCFNNAGLYDASLTVTSALGCSDIVTLTDHINVVAVPIADFVYAPQLITEMEPDVSFANTSFAASNYSWDLGDGSISSSVNVQHTYADTGIYCVTLLASNALGCADTVTHCLVVDPVFTLYIPNSFTPNTDAMNPIFQVYGRGIKSISVYIFDRWGEEIFSYFNINSGWNGDMSSGSACPQGVYTYRVVAVDAQNKEHQFMGNVNLIR